MSLRYMGNGVESVYEVGDCGGRIVEGDVGGRCYRCKGCLRERRVAVEGVLLRKGVGHGGSGIGEGD